MYLQLIFLFRYVHFENLSSPNLEDFPEYINFLSTLTHYVFSMQLATVRL
jgi:hypothetical protein